ncbi:MAG TPA: hypothetical protein VGG48_02575 [Rhizomicrobium sp.]|jgi:nitroreductase
MTPEEFTALVAQANLAPSVHNTQPTRWRLNPDGSVLVLEDTARRLLVGDPTGRDAAVSHGAAIEGFALACAAKGWATTLSPPDASDGVFRTVGRLTLSPTEPSDSLHDHIRTRRTYRGAFPRADNRSGELQAGDVTLVSNPDGVGRLAQLNDEASLRTFRNKAFRAELVSWMRLSRNDPHWALDGLNAEAMAMSPIEAVGAGIVLKPGLFEFLDSLGAARLFVAEAPVVRSSQAVALFHRPATESALDTGRRFYRLWLEFTKLGLSAAPMTVLADDAEALATITREFHMPENRRLITAFRLGVAPEQKQHPKARLPVSKLVV